jgi:hypothetical protein
MTTLSAPSIEQRLPAMAALIYQAIPGSEVRLFGSRARGQAGPESDIDLMITAPDSWLRRMAPWICCSTPAVNARHGAIGAAI